MGFLLKPLFLIVFILTLKAAQGYDDKCEAGSSDCPKPRRIKRSNVPCLTLEAAVVLDHTFWFLFPGLTDSEREQNITNHFRRVYAEANTRLSYWKDYAVELERQGSTCPVKCLRVYPRIFQIQKTDATDWSATVKLRDGKLYVVHFGGCQNSESMADDVTHCWTRLDIASVDAVSQQPLTYYRALGFRGVCNPISVTVLEALGYGEDFLVAHAVLQALGNPVSVSSQCYFWDRGNDLFPWISAVQPNPVMAQYLNCMSDACNYVTLDPGSCAFQNAFSSADWDALASLSNTAVPYSYDQVCQLNMGMTARYSGKTTFPQYMCKVGIACSDGHNNVRYVPVLSNTRCEEGKICRKGWCEWKDLGELGGHCFRDEDCLTANTLCNCDACECRRGYRRSNSTCVQLKKLKCPDNWIQYGYLCYYINHALLQWGPAMDACISWNGTLVEIDEQSKTEFFVNLLQSNDTYEYFIGGQFSSSLQKFRWVGSNMVLDYSIWDTDYPRYMYNHVMSCLIVLKHGQFRNTWCAYDFYKSICQRISP